MGIFAVFLFVERIDKIIWKSIIWATNRPRIYIWRWWQYGYKEPLIDSNQANITLKNLCGYNIMPHKPMKLYSCRPGIHWFKFGIYVTATPIQADSRYWKLYWGRWIFDPLELHLVRSVLRPKVTSPSIPPQPKTVRSSLLDTINVEDWL